MELSVLKATKILLKANQQQDEVLIRHNSMKGSTVSLRDVSVYEAAWGPPTFPPHSKTSVDMLRAGDLRGLQMQLWSVRVGSPSLQSITWPDFLNATRLSWMTASIQLAFLLGEIYTSFLKIGLFILYPGCYFPSFLASQSLPPSALCPQPQSILPFLLSERERAGLPWMSTKHSIASFSETKHLPVF